MKKFISLISILILSTTLFVGCGNQNKAQPKLEKQIIENETTEDKPKETDLKASELYKEMDTVMPFKIIELSESVSKDYKTLRVEFEVKKANTENEIKEFYENCNLIASYISTRAKDKEYNSILFSNKQLGAISTYSAKEELEGFMTLDTASFSKKEYQDIFDKLRDK